MPQRSQNVSIPNKLVPNLVACHYRTKGALRKLERGRLSPPTPLCDKRKSDRTPSRYKFIRFFSEHIKAAPAGNWMTQVSHLRKLASAALGNFNVQWCVKGRSEWNKPIN
jgi:hypothetical protein